MSGTTHLRRYSRYLAAGVDQIIDVPESTFVHIAGGDDPLTIRPDGQNPCQVEAGIKLQYDRPFKKLWVNSDTWQTVEFYIGTGDVTDNRLVGNVNISGGLSIAGNATLYCNQISITTSLTSIRGNDNTRSRLIIYHESGSPVRIGSSAITWGATPVGIILNPGDTFEYKGEPGINAMTASGTATLQYMQEGN